MKEKLKTLVLAFSGIIVHSALIIATEMFIDSTDKALMTADIFFIVIGGLYANTILQDTNVYKPPNKKFIAVSIAIVVSYVFISMLTVNAFLKMFSPPDNASEIAGEAENGTYLLSSLTSIFLSPLVEEIIFRKFMYGELAKSGKIITAAMISSAIFAIYHGTVIHLYAALFGGLMFCCIYAKTHKLRYSIAAHFLFNVIAFFIVYIPYPAFMFDYRLCIALNVLLITAMIFWAKMDAGAELMKRSVLTEAQKKRREETKRLVEEVMAEHNKQQ